MPTEFWNWGYNCCFFLNFVPLHIESPYNFGGTGPILGVKNPLQRVNGHAVIILSLLLRELKKGETFASLLNIHDGDIRVVPTHLFFSVNSLIKSLLEKCIALLYYYCSFWHKRNHKGVNSFSLKSLNQMEQNLCIYICQFSLVVLSRFLIKVL